MNKGYLTTVLVLAFLAFGPVAGSGQQPAPAGDELASDTSKDDILILVNVTAKELRFDAVPNTSVQFPGSNQRRTIWVTQRQNLPETVEPGVTYRNIGIQLTISSRFEDIERIVSEALGEVPVTETQPVDPTVSSGEPSPGTAPSEKPVAKPTPAQSRGRPKPGLKR